ncbi:unnamed protein product [Darwinula stevensoni]|uniref:Uncharacterized protein n=1 Tax=Darwinula stevensoni TaxID=69355 RepID=A0A7R9AA84_9CRUS|nr:unnamed protein product [Darwinula stevensoni]CAG0898172.1 unnamed protein product [Darwinula stevensoni]
MRRYGFTLRCYHCGDAVECEGMWHEMTCEGDVQPGNSWYCGEYRDQNNVLQTVNCSEWNAAGCVTGPEGGFPDGWDVCFCDWDFCNAGDEKSR